MTIPRKMLAAGARASCQRLKFTVPGRLITGPSSDRPSPTLPEAELRRTLAGLQKQTESERKDGRPGADKKSRSKGYKGRGRPDELPDMPHVRSGRGPRPDHFTGPWNGTGPPRRSERPSTITPESAYTRSGPESEWQQEATSAELRRIFQNLERDAGDAGKDGSAGPSMRPRRADFRGSTSSWNTVSSRKLRRDPHSDPVEEPEIITPSIKSLALGVVLDLPADPAVPAWSKGQSVMITWEWLRDSCQCPSCVQPSTKQKLHRSGTYIVAPATDSVKATVQDVDGVPSLKIVWSADKEGREPWRDEPEHAGKALKEHVSIYSLTWIRQHAPQRPVFESNFFMSPQLWDRRTLEASPTLRIPYELFKSSPAHLHAALAQVQVYGLVVLTGVPTHETSDAKCELRQAMQHVGEIRNTFYGPTWDVKAIKDSKNIAYTNVDLGVHMDLCYFESPPRFQSLHCLRNRVQGGSSYFVDSFAAVDKLRREHPREYRILTNTPIPFLYDNDGYYYYNEHRTIELGAADHHRPAHIRDKAARFSKVMSVNYSPPFQAPLNGPEGARTPWRTISLPQPQLSGHSQPQFQSHELFKALRTFDELLHKPEAVYEFTLQEGDLAWFDNRRVLHARRAFNDYPQDSPQYQSIAKEIGDGEATRWLKGCYMDGDVVWNKLRYMTRLGLDMQPSDDEGKPFELLAEWKSYLTDRVAAYGTKAD